MRKGFLILLLSGCSEKDFVYVYKCHLDVKQMGKQENLLKKLIIIGERTCVFNAVLVY